MNANPEWLSSYSIGKRSLRTDLFFVISADLIAKVILLWYCVIIVIFDEDLRACIVSRLFIKKFTLTRHC